MLKYSNKFISRNVEEVKFYRKYGQNLKKYVEYI